MSACYKNRCNNKHTNFKAKALFWLCNDKKKTESDDVTFEMQVLAFVNAASQNHLFFFAILRQN